MALTADDYLAQLQELLPAGPAWPRDPSASLTKLLSGISAEFARVDGRAEQLVFEADPRLTSELLLDFERIAGLPDSCVPLGQSTIERRQALVGRLTMSGGQSPAYFIALAAALGFTVTISQFPAHSVNSLVDYPLYSGPWRFTWQVNAALNTIKYLDVNGLVSDPLASWGNALLECVLGKFKPAHTILLFAYS